MHCVKKKKKFNVKQVSTEKEWERYQCSRKSRSVKATTAPITQGVWLPSWRFHKTWLSTCVSQWKEGARRMASATSDTSYSSKGTACFICVSRPAHALISASGKKKKNKKISKKIRTSGQVRGDKYCPQQSQRKRQIARRKQQYYGDWWRR